MSFEERPAVTDPLPPVASRADRREELNSVTLSQDVGKIFVPENLGQLTDMAAMMAKSGPMIKDTFRDNPGACAGLIMICAPLGMNPFQVSWKTYQTKPGAPLAFEAQLVSAMVMRGAPIRGRLRYEYEGDGAARRCNVSAIDRDTGEVVEAWSPPIGQISPKNSPLWKTDPDQQLGYYTVRMFARRHYPEILMGIIADDEAGGMPARSEPRDITPAPRAAAVAAITAGLPEDDEVDDPLPTEAEREAAMAEAERAANAAAQEAAE